MRRSLYTLLFATGWLVIQLSLVQHEYSATHTLDNQCEWCTQYTSHSDDTLVDNNAGLSNPAASGHRSPSVLVHPGQNGVTLSYSIRAPPKA